MDDMGSYLTGADSSRNLDTTAKSLFSGIGNIVGASSKTSKKAQNSTGADAVSSLTARSPVVFHLDVGSIL
jgi:hypothetical protein